MCRFAERLRQAMELRGVKQAELQRLSGTSQSNISMMLNEERVPRVDLAARLARALDVRLDWLCGLPLGAEGPLSAEESGLLLAFRRLPDARLRRVVFDVVRALTPGAEIE